MGLFGLGGRGKSGGILNVIRCDEQEYLVWKWRPEGQAVNSTTRENSIRYGSSLRVKDGEVAVFVYKQKDGTMQDFIEGPYDDTIKTANFPVLSSIVGLAFGGESPFQAEIYFINLAGNVQIKFGIPYFDVFDPRFLDFAVPVAVRGTITFNITDYRAFIKLNRMINFTLEDFKKQVKDAVTKYVKSFVANAPQDNGIPVLQLERKIADISDLLQARLSKEMADDFGVNLKLVRPFIGALIGGALGGFTVVLAGVGMSGIGVTGIPGLALVAPQSMVMYIIGMAVAFVGAFVATWIMGFKEETGA